MTTTSAPALTAQLDTIHTLLMLDARSDNRVIPARQFATARWVITETRNIIAAGDIEKASDLIAELTDIARRIS